MKVPEAVLDDQGVTHYNEVALPAEYGEGECECGKHPLSQDTWYHSTIKMNVAGDHKIVRKCKKCNEVLIRKKKG